MSNNTANRKRVACATRIRRANHTFTVEAKGATRTSITTIVEGKRADAHKPTAKGARGGHARERARLADMTKSQRKRERKRLRSPNIKRVSIDALREMRVKKLTLKREKRKARKAAKAAKIKAMSPTEFMLYVARNKEQNAANAKARVAKNMYKQVKRDRANGTKQQVAISMGGW